MVEKFVLVVDIAIVVHGRNTSKYGEMGVTNRPKAAYDKASVLSVYPPFSVCKRMAEATDRCRSSVWIDDRSLAQMSLSLANCE